MNKISKLTTVIFCLQLCLISCKKREMASPELPDGSGPHLTELRFEQGAIDIGTIDSVTVHASEFTLGIDRKYTAKLSRKNNIFYTDIFLGQQERKIRVSVYTRAEAGKQFGHAYLLDTLVYEKPLKVAAPSGSLDDPWRPCIFFTDPNLGLRFVLPERTTEDWYDLDGAMLSPWTMLNIGRRAELRGTVQAEEDLWHDAELYFKKTVFEDGRMFDIDVFGSFSQAIRGREWDSAEYRISLSDQLRPHNDIHFRFVYPKRR